MIGTFRPTEIGSFRPTQNGRFRPTLTMAIMTRIPGWEKTSLRQQIPLCGQQWLYRPAAVKGIVTGVTKEAVTSSGASGASGADR